MKSGDCVRWTTAFKNQYENTTMAPHIKEFGDCIGVIQGPMFLQSWPEAPELDVRWHPSNLRYGYDPSELEIALPVTYFSDFVQEPGAAFIELRDGLDWERRADAPRSEYYCNDYPESYIYGRGKGRRLYEPRPYHPRIIAIRTALEKLTGATFEVCFLNRYLNQSDQLGWHADDSPEMDIIKKTYDEIQAVLLNSEQDPRLEITTALFAVVEFAQKEGQGMSKRQIRWLFEEALDGVEDDPVVADRPSCFGVNRSTKDVLCVGGSDPTYADSKTGSHKRPRCDFYKGCGSAMGSKVGGQLVTIAKPLQP